MLKTMTHRQSKWSAPQRGVPSFDLDGRFVDEAIPVIDGRRDNNFAVRECVILPARER